MPIYEFYCRDCNAIFSFLSKTIDTQRRPDCPRCGRKRLEREVSPFAQVGRAKEEAAAEPPFDESKMERAMESLVGQVDGIDEKDPRQAANLMRKFSNAAGMKLGEGMEEALRRMEAGENPEQIEAEMGDRLNEEDPFEAPEGASGATRGKMRGAPSRDSKLYEM